MLLEAMQVPDGAAWHSALHEVFAEDALINVCHPFNRIDGPDAYQATFLHPLQKALHGLYRRDYIVMGGAFEDQQWVSASGYYAGHFQNPWISINPTGTLAYLRFGEFHRFQNEKIVESYIFLDLPELMIAAGQWPIKSSPGNDRGYTGFLPGPATQDGLLYRPEDPAVSEQSLSMVTDMLRKLATKDEKWRPYWHDNMVWYGPAAFGSFVGIENFAGFQVPFEQVLDGWAGGAVIGGKTKHFSRFADNEYVCSGGWPSLTGIQVQPFLDQPPTKKRLYMRVCDWWRRQGDLLMENWVFVDIPDVLRQMGYDMFKNLERAS